MSLYHNSPHFIYLTEKIDEWDRYLDDTFTLFDGTPSEAIELYKIINNFHETIKFPDPQIGHMVEFLDIQICINNHDLKIEFELFIKPTNVGIFLNYHSAHPKSVIISSAKNELHRAYKRSNTSEGALRGVSKIYYFLTISHLQ